MTSLTFQLQSRGTQVYLTHLRPEVWVTFESAGIIKLLGEDKICEDVAEAISKASFDPDVQPEVPLAASGSRRDSISEAT